MKNRFTYRDFFRILLTLAAYGYLAYVLLTFRDWDLLGARFREAGAVQWLWLLGAAALIPLNYLLEAVKWRYLLRDVERISLWEAQRQVYFGILGAFITPERLGDYPTRATRLKKENMLPAIALGFVGSMALVSVNILCGLPALCFGGLTYAGIRGTAVIIASLLLLAVFAAVCCLLPRIAKAWLAKLEQKDNTPAATAAKRDLLRETLGALSRFSAGRFPVLLGMSLARYLVFSLQFALILVFCGVALSPLQYIVAIPVYYLFVTVLPSLPAADVAIRGSIGALVFSLFTPATAGVAIAAVLVWVLNTLIPMLCGTFVKKRP